MFETTVVKDIVAKKKNRRKQNRKKTKGEPALKESVCNGNDRAQDVSCNQPVDDNSDNEFEQRIIDFELRLSNQSMLSNAAVDGRKLKPNVSSVWLEDIRRKTHTITH